MEMKLLGSRFKKIFAERNINFNGKIEIDQNINIKDIKEFEKKDSISVDYVYTINYKNLGKIEIEGILYLEVIGTSRKNLIKEWKSKKIDSDEQIKIINLIVHKASLKAIDLEEELGLPIHFRLPSLQNKKE